MVTEEGLVGGAALQNGAVGCCLVDGVLVVVAGEERRFAQPTLSAGVESSGQRTAELLIRCCVRP